GLRSSTNEYNLYCLRCKAGQYGPCPQRPRRQPAESPGAAKRVNDRQWRDLRELKLSDEPLCDDCQQKGIVTPAVDVHHVVKISDDPTMRLDRSNLMPLCKRCHSARTARGE